MLNQVIDRSITNYMEWQELKIELDRLLSES